MQNGEEHRALQREIMMARAGQSLNHSPAARLLPQSFERQRRSDASRRTRCRLASSDGVDDNGFGGEAGARAQQALQLPALAQILDPSERGDDLLAHRGAFATAFDDLEIGAAAGGSLTEIHGADPRERLIVGAHTIPWSANKVNRNQRRRGTTFSRNLRLDLTISMTYDPHRGRHCCKISLTAPAPPQVTMVTGIVDCGKGMTDLQELRANGSFCAMLWLHFYVNTLGRSTPCCISPEPFADENGEFFDIRKHSIREIWNSPAHTKLREEMRAGRRVSACSHCYKYEDSTGESTRTKLNKWLLEDHERAAHHQEVIEREGRGEAPPTPGFLDIRLSNLCNLGCRMCSAEASSQIEKDSVHSKWSPN